MGKIILKIVARQY